MEVLMEAQRHGMKSGIPGQSPSVSLRSLSDLLRLLEEAGSCLAERCDRRIRIATDDNWLLLRPSTVEQLMPPALRTICNAVAYSIEPVDERRRLGKPDEGSVWIFAHNKGSDLCLTITDDGKGMNESLILESAVNSGLVEQRQTATMSPEDIRMLPFHPDFKVTPEAAVHCGCGLPLVGMHSLLDNLDAQLSVCSHLGIGTSVTFEIRNVVELAASASDSEPDYEQSTRQSAAPSWWVLEQSTASERHPHFEPCPQPADS
ncbi:MAG: hypothetical protein KDA96_19595 [Planctomycetaceae bacterium]|nr:hypothetical protein [Planctomycetaceae bacterium]